MLVRTMTDSTETASLSTSVSSLAPMTPIGSSNLVEIWSVVKAELLNATVKSTNRYILKVGGRSSVYV